MTAAVTDMGAATRAGRPLRFLATVLAGWTGVRVWLLWPAVEALPMPHLARAEAAPLELAAMRPDPPALPEVALAGGGRPARTPVAAAPGPGPSAIVRERPAERVAQAAPPAAPAPALRFADPVPAPAPAAAATGKSSRLSGSAWALLRGGPALAGGLAGGQLGGSQAGVRLSYAVDGARRLAVTARLSSAVGGSGPGRREAAAGIAWRPTRAPVTLLAEQRFSLDGARGGPVLGVIAGLGPARIAAGFRLEAYGQAGGIVRDGVEGFGDGAARLTRPVAIGPVRLDVGAGTWGGIQRGARRLDVGPTIGAALPVAGHRLRLAADWRARVAGDARPGSGPALSLGTDF